MANTPKVFRKHKKKLLTGERQMAAHISKHGGEPYQMDCLVKVKF